MACCVLGPTFLGPYSRTPLCAFPGALLFALVTAQENHCDRDLNAPAGHPYGYRLRGDRCEGIYVQEINCTTLRIASLIESFEDYDPASGKDLLVQWPAFGHRDIRLRTQSLKRRLYYRMDTVRPPGSTSYTWPSHLLAALKISKRDLGIMGWTRYAVGNTEQSVYVPLRISQQQQPLQLGNYQLVLLPCRELIEVFVSLAAIGVDGHPVSFLRDGEALEYGYYTDERDITIPITGLEIPGVYYLEIGATLKGGGVTTVELWFYHLGA
jgi:hypothetical protein